VEGVVPIIEGPLPTEDRAAARFDFLAGRNFLAQRVELFRRDKSGKVRQVRVLRNPLPEAADEKAVPQFVVGLEQRHRRRQAEIMAEPFEQPDAIAVDRAEESLLKGALDPRRNRRFANRHARFLLHLLRRAHRVGHDDQPRQAVDRFRFGQARQMDDALDNGAWSCPRPPAR
jgi:hypothetical protein